MEMAFHTHALGRKHTHKQANKKKQQQLEGKKIYRRVGRED